MRGLATLNAAVALLLLLGLRSCSADDERKTVSRCLTSFMHHLYDGQYMTDSQYMHEVAAQRFNANTNGQGGAGTHFLAQLAERVPENNNGAYCKVTFAYRNSAVPSVNRDCYVIYDKHYGTPIPAAVLGEDELLPTTTNEDTNWFITNDYTDYTLDNFGSMWKGDVVVGYPLGKFKYHAGVRSTGPRPPPAPAGEVRNNNRGGNQDHLQNPGAWRRNQGHQQYQGGGPNPQIRQVFGSERYLPRDPDYIPASPAHGDQRARVSANQRASLREVESSGPGPLPPPPTEDAYGPAGVAQYRSTSPPNVPYRSTTDRYGSSVLNNGFYNSDQRRLSGGAQSVRSTSPLRGTQLTAASTRPATGDPDGWLLPPKQKRSGEVWENKDVNLAVPLVHQAEETPQPQLGKKIIMYVNKNTKQRMVEIHFEDGDPVAAYWNRNHAPPVDMSSPRNSSPPQSARVSSNRSHNSYPRQSALQSVNSQSWSGLGTSTAASTRPATRNPDGWLLPPKQERPGEVWEHLENAYLAAPLVTDLAEEKPQLPRGKNIIMYTNKNTKRRMVEIHYNNNDPIAAYRNRNHESFSASVLCPTPRNGERWAGIDKNNGLHFVDGREYTEDTNLQGIGQTRMYTDKDTRNRKVQITFGSDGTPIAAFYNIKFASTASPASTAPPASAASQVGQSQVGMRYSSQYGNVSGNRSNSAPINNAGGNNYTGGKNYTSASPPSWVQLVHVDRRWADAAARSLGGLPTSTVSGKETYCVRGQPLVRVVDDTVVGNRNHPSYHALQKKHVVDTKLQVRSDSTRPVRQRLPSSHRSSSRRVVAA